MSTLDQLDLNLLRTLDVLLATRSVTEAASRLGRSQPAVSHALGRLRDALGDPLLVRQGRGLVPTPRAEALAAAVHPLLRQLEVALDADAVFDPSTARRTFRLACPDVLAPIVPDLLSALAVAPGVELELLGLRGPRATEEADLALDALPDDAPGVVARSLGRVHQAIVCRKGHPLTEAPVTLERWVAWPHVLVRTTDGAPSLVDRVLADQGHSRTIGLFVPNLLLVPHVVSRSDLVFTGPREILRTLEGPLGLVLLPHPLPLPPVPVAAMWHERFQADPGHRWFRHLIASVVEHHLANEETP